LVAEAQKFNAAVLGGIESGGGGAPRISQKGGKVWIYDNKAEEPRQLITWEDPQTKAQLPAMMLQVVVVGANPNKTKAYYEGPYVDGEDREPDCQSSDGIVPDERVENPVSNACATCPMNRWG